MNSYFKRNNIFVAKKTTVTRNNVNFVWRRVACKEKNSGLKIVFEKFFVVGKGE